MRFWSLSSDMYDNVICGADCGEDRQNRLIFRVFRLISAVFEVFRVPLTPSFVGSNPATPATDTIYCIRNLFPNTIYGFCFIWLFSLFPNLGKCLGKLFGRNFVFCPVFLPVLPAEAGSLFYFRFFKNMVWGNFCQ